MARLFSWRLERLDPFLAPVVGSLVVKNQASSTEH